MAGECWASTIDACAGGGSEEHYFSRGLFRDEEVTIEGGPFSEPTTLPVARLVTNSLCQRHNGLLSQLDQEAIDVANVLRELDRLWTMRLRQPFKHPGPPAITLTVNGSRLERWMLKAMLSLTRVFNKRLDGWRPPPFVAQAAFGLRELPRGCGLALAHHVGDQLVHRETFGITFGGTPADASPTAFVVTFLSWRFLLSWEKPLESLYPLRVGARTYGKEDAFLLHPTRMRYQISRTGRTQVPANLFLDFLWNHPGRQAQRNVASLRRPVR